MNILTGKGEPPTLWVTKESEHEEIETKRNTEIAAPASDTEVPETARAEIGSVEKDDGVWSAWELGKSFRLAQAALGEA